MSTALLAQELDLADIDRHFAKFIAQFGVRLALLKARLRF